MIHYPDYNAIRLETFGPVMTLYMNRPDARNSVTLEMALELYDVVRRIARDTSVKVLVLRGLGKDFCCGADLKSDATDPTGDDTTGPELDFYHISTVLHEMPAVTIAAIRGGCAGAGFGWATACDIRVADDSVTFNTAFLDVGVAGDMGVPWTLSRLIGGGRTRDLSFFPRKLKGPEALQIGLITRLWPVDSFEAELDALVARLANAAPLALGMMKSNYVEAERVDLATFIRLETERHTRLFQSADRIEAFKAWVEKRPGNYKGR